MQICIILCKMADKFKSDEDIRTIAATLRLQRLSLGITLIEIESETGVNRGQLSRLERGEFKTNGPNLQKYKEFLQRKGDTQNLAKLDLGTRFDNFAARSPRHRAAAEELMHALEQLS